VALEGEACRLCDAKDPHYLETLISRLDQVVAQTRLRLSGETPEGATRLVSLHDPDARRIKKAGSQAGNASWSAKERATSLRHSGEPSGP
jgi:hypothetical protein